MIVFPNCKINLGLHVINKRSDGFHSLQTVFYPINWCDSLEVIEHDDNSEPFIYSQSGILVDGPIENNILFKTWQILKKEIEMPLIKVHLHKNIPMGAGLGGGSSDAAFFINLLNEKFNLGISEKKKIKMAVTLGSDCAFFINNKPVYAEGRGDELSNINLDLSSYFILLIYPAIHSTTAEAFSKLTPKAPAMDLKKIISKYEPEDWKEKMKNDFEEPIFEKYPLIKKIKTDLYDSGALYASLSGSGSSVYGIYAQEPTYKADSAHLTYLQKPQSKIL